MLIGVGASTWASGNQVWNGTAGTLIRNPIISSMKNVFAVVPASPPGINRASPC